MDERVLTLRTPEECEKFARNAVRHGRTDLAVESRHRALELRARDTESETPAENEALQAVHAYEEVLSLNNGKRSRASRVWQLVKRHGIIEALERTLKRDGGAEEYAVLNDLGIEDFIYEAVVVRHPDVFSAEAVEKSKQNLADWAA